MPGTLTVALVGDFSAEVIAHRAIPKAIEIGASVLGLSFAPRWIPTETIHDAASQLRNHAGLWVVPASPYRNTQGALDAIRWARETGRPFLGTCGGFQHALIEFARNVAGIAGADHAENNPEAQAPVVAALACPLVEKSGRIHFAPGSKLRTAYRAESAFESYHCNFGLNPACRATLEGAGLAFTALDDLGDVRGAELPIHPFFVGTLFQPERAALRGDSPPLVEAFLRACQAGAQ